MNRTMTQPQHLAQFRIKLSRKDWIEVGQLFVMVEGTPNRVSWTHKRSTLLKIASLIFMAIWKYCNAHARKISVYFKQLTHTEYYPVKRITSGVLIHIKTIDLSRLSLYSSNQKVTRCFVQFSALFYLLAPLLPVQ